MKKFFYYPLFFVLLSTFVIACNDDEPVNMAPVITVTSPTDAEFQAGFTQGQNVTITGTVEDDNLISTLTSEIFWNGINSNLGETVPVDQKSTSINQSFNTSNAPAGTYKVVLIATDDQGLSTRWEKTFVLR